MARTAYETESRSNPGTWHEIGFGRDGTLTCTCKGYYYRETCHHVKQARQLVGAVLDNRPDGIRNLRAALLALLVEVELPRTAMPALYGGG